MVRPVDPTAIPEVLTFRRNQDALTDISVAVPSSLASGDVWDAELANLGTVVGALCFLVGATLLLPAARRVPA